MDKDTSLLKNMQEDSKIYGTVEIDQLRSVWKARKYLIQVPHTLVQSGLLPSIFDWQFLGQLMPSEQAEGESLLQQRINNLELLNSLMTNLLRVQVLPETGVEVALAMGRPSYNVQLLNDGKILVKEQPSLHLHITAGESFRAAAGQERVLELDYENDKLEQNVSNKEATKPQNSNLQSKSEPKEFEESSEVSNQAAYTHLAQPKNDVDSPTQLQDIDDFQLPRHLSYWIRFSNWIRQVFARLTARI